MKKRIVFSLMFIFFSSRICLSESSLDSETYQKGKKAEDSKDFIQALKWYQKAASNGNASAENALGHLYLRGEGVPQDLQKSMEWYRKAAKQGDPEGETNVGHGYAMGYGVTRDYHKALEWYLKAAALQNGRAEFFIG